MKPRETQPRRIYRSTIELLNVICERERRSQIDVIDLAVQTYARLNRHTTHARRPVRHLPAEPADVTA